MARRRKLSSNGIEFDDHVDLTPMLDCVFVLLLFLIIATTFDEDGLFKVIMPTAQQSTVRGANESITLLVGKDGSYAIGRDLIPEARLIATLTKLRDEQHLTTIVIKGDQSAPYRSIVAAVDAAQALGITEYALVVARPQ